MLLMNVKGSLFEKQRIDIVKDVSQVEGIQKHRKEVRKLCFSFGLYWQGLIHDLSKYSRVRDLNAILDCSKEARISAQARIAARMK